eukprot:CAMPEP_0195020478 /NCGR_PEP_ID=MMETSP0326_2-20130528/35370_1 /TAXON_ID=2866 ORGANISM="Crypthecodinium cohnii, Strain Seligo" /NCGR_SAMPLE_ID=MMETSP0326_2 /ASSEMBLY_ACC=CAM_ASM_000348 /LENGTH=173 /DNA_ID=CAMNT_0040039149 /DNA_START=114 /DNA_END=632 /DNA_ORIENTATION=+
MTCFEASFDALSVAEFTKCLASSSSAFSSSSFPSKAAATSSEASALFSSPKLSKHRPSVQCAQCQSGRHSTACSAARQASKSRFIASKTWAICSRMEPFSLSDGANKRASSHLCRASEKRSDSASRLPSRVNRWHLADRSSSCPSMADGAGVSSMASSSRSSSRRKATTSFPS